MELSDVKIRLVNQDGKLKGVASLVIDGCFAVHDIKIVEGEGGVFVAMPSRKTPDGEYKDARTFQEQSARSLSSGTRRRTIIFVSNAIKSSKTDIRQSTHTCQLSRRIFTAPTDMFLHIVIWAYSHMNACRFSQIIFLLICALEVDKKQRLKIFASVVFC